VLAAVRKHGELPLMWTAKEFREDPEIMAWAKLSRLQRALRRWRDAVRHMSIGWYWFGLTFRAAFAPDGAPTLVGAGAKRARADYEADLIV
jgi:hypothetical protein